MEQSRRRRYLRMLIWPVLALVCLYTLWCMWGSIKWTKTVTTHHPAGVEIRSVSLHELRPYAGVEGVPLPIPSYRVNADYERVLLVNGLELWRGSDIFADRMYPCPTGRYVLIENAQRTKPIRIMVCAAGASTELAVPNSRDEFPSHYYVYPFHFLRWEDDESFTVEVTGANITPGPGPVTQYRQVWRVNAKTSARVRVE